MRDNYKAWEIEPLADLRLNKEDLYKHLISWAILAANSHNVQPWKFIIRPGENAIEICVHEKGVLPASDKIGREAFISAGCALANLLVAADYYGLIYNVEFKKQKVFYPDWAAKIIFQGNQGNFGDRNILIAMENRLVNRSEYDSQKDVPEDALKEMGRIAEQEEIRLRIIKDKLTKIAVSEIQYIADNAVIAFKDFRRELADYLLPNDTDSFVGMPGNTLGLSDESAKKLHEQLKTGNIDSDTAKGMAIYNSTALRKAPVICVLNIKEDTPFWWLKAGLVFEKIFVLAQMRGLSVAVHAAIVEVGAFNKMLQARLLDFKYRPTVIFRMGYAKEERPHAPRLPAEKTIEVQPR